MGMGAMAMDEDGGATTRTGRDRRQDGEEEICEGEYMCAILSFLDSTLDILGSPLCNPQQLRPLGDCGRKIWGRSLFLPLQEAGFCGGGGRRTQRLARRYVSS